MTGLMIAALTAATASATPAPKGTKRYIVTFDAKAKKADRDAALGKMSLKASKDIATDGAMGPTTVGALNDAIARNHLREGKARVPPPAIYITARKLVPPSLEEGFDEVKVIAPLPVTA